jgi:outer membrane receptor protein involved in Fe transport
VGDSYYDLTYTEDNQSILKVGRNFTHDLSLSYDISRRVTIQLNIDNITNQQPPFPATYAVGYYDFIGRYFLFGAHAKF